LQNMRVYKLKTPITRVHDLAFTQPNNAPVISRQDYSARCDAREATYKTCRFPYARAFDHQDRAVKVHTRLYRVNRQPVNGPAISEYKRVTKVTFGVRSTYLFRYDATDLTGNKATQLVFALTLDDLHKPKIQTCLPAFSRWEAASDAKLCYYNSVYDNIDKMITHRLRYTIIQLSDYTKTFKPKKVLCKLCTFKKARSSLHTRHVKSRFIIRLDVWDNARLYGRGGRSNHAYKTRALLISDTKAPWFKLHGSEPARHQCGFHYKDAGYTAYDLLDTEAMRPAVKLTCKKPTPSSPWSTIDSKVGHYKVYFNCRDRAMNHAKTRTRRVIVRDTLKPTIKLLGLSEIVHYAGEKFSDPGSTCWDRCAKRNVKTVLNWSRQWNDRVLGDYLRTYTCTDPSHNWRKIVRKFTIVDNTAPKLKIVGVEIDTLEATRDTEYTDKGATCHDYVDGTLSHAVEVSGNVVNMRIPGKYVIRYDCQDLSGNQAMPLNRTVFVKDTRCPRVYLKGVGIVYIESGFHYVDALATATDDLDGDITQKIWTDGDTVDTSANYFMRQSCRDILKKTSNPLTGEYYIQVKGMRTLVWCDFHSKSKGTTYFAVNGGKRVIPYGAAQGSCAKYGLRMMRWKAASQLNFAKRKFAKKFFPRRGSSSDAYLCTTDKVTAAGNYKYWNTKGQDKIFGTGKKHATAGKYIINFHVKDRAGNRECKPARRTIIVKDLIPMAITTHLRYKLVNRKASDYKNIIKRNKYMYGVSGSHNHWPLFNVKSRFGGSKFMAETATTSTTSGWVIGAVASAVTGLALLSYGSRKQSATSVPV